ncbi:MAG: dicarboxylate/amino acid:cation symporter [Paludibacteraceae bacterium]|nr:dicarboxylate/amino acid:cation symporter [Paludibacteraceae bacterium]
MRIPRIPLLVRVLIAIALGIAFGLFMPAWGVRIFTTFNALFDQLLRFLIPLIILGLVTPAIADLGKGASRLLLLTVGIAYVATVLSGLFGYGCSMLIFPHIIHACEGETTAAGAVPAFPPYFEVSIPPLFDVMTALATAFLLGLGIAFLAGKESGTEAEGGLKRAAREFQSIVVLAIQKVIIPLLPLYIFGVFMSMTASGEAGTILVNFAEVIAVLIGLTLVILLLQYLVAGAVVKRNPFKLLWTMSPAYFTALGCCSSAATIPVTLRQTLQNGVNADVAGFVVPLCATIHMSGSIAKITGTAIAIMLMQGVPFDAWQIVGFVLMLAITMVAAPGVPGGCVMASLGLLGSMLGFTGEQQALMIAIYIAIDSFGTACNVTGDGAIALIIDKIQSTNKLKQL